MMDDDESRLQEFLRVEEKRGDFCSLTDASGPPNQYPSNLCKAVFKDKSTENKKVHMATVAPGQLAFLAPSKLSLPPIYAVLTFILIIK